MHFSCKAEDCPYKNLVFLICFSFFSFLLFRTEGKEYAMISMQVGKVCGKE